MTNLEYLKDIIEKISIRDDGEEIKALRSEASKIEKILKGAFKGGDLTIKPGGSLAKGTMIKESYDLDLICYFGREDESAGKTLKEIYDSVKKALETDYFVNPKKSALRIESKQRVYFHVDVVPGRFVDGDSDDVFLYQEAGDKDYLKTNLSKHIDHVKSRGKNMTDIIKLLKFWRERNGLQSAKTFILELLTIEILKGKDLSRIDNCLDYFLREVSESIQNYKIEDPANPTGNDLSELFNDSVKNLMSSSAKNSLYIIGQQGWQGVFGEIESTTDDEKLASIQKIQSQNPGPRPWLRK